MMDPRTAASTYSLLVRIFIFVTYSSVRDALGPVLVASTVGRVATPFLGQLPPGCLMDR